MAQEADPLKHLPKWNNKYAHFQWLAFSFNAGIKLVNPYAFQVSFKMNETGMFKYHHLFFIMLNRAKRDANDGSKNRIRKLFFLKPLFNLSCRGKHNKRFSIRKTIETTYLPSFFSRKIESNRA